MRRSNNFVQIMGFVECTISSEHEIRIPIVQGILKHPTIELLRELLKKPAVAKKYTIESLRRAPWKVLKEFPYSWLKLSIEEANLKPERKKAIVFMISDESRGMVGEGDSLGEVRGRWCRKCVTSQIAKSECGAIIQKTV
ncbi:MAG: hypothetical protein QME81_19470 [bacterium]|nr:hypothetical protein [bacterium]